MGAGRLWVGLAAKGRRPQEGGRGAVPAGLARGKWPEAGHASEPRGVTALHHPMMNVTVLIVVIIPWRVRPLLSLARSGSEDALGAPPGSGHHVGCPMFGCRPDPGSLGAGSPVTPPHCPPPPTHRPQAPPLKPPPPPPTLSSDLCSSLDLDHQPVPGPGALCPPLS